MTPLDGAKTLRLETDRLVLLALTAELTEVLKDLAAATIVFGAAIPADWPDKELAGLLDIYGPWIAEDTERLGYGPWVLIARDEGSVVGSAGFMGKQPENGEPIELGYGVHPDFRNCGYATEATRALVEWGLAQPPVERVIAKCDPGNASSVRVLEKIGMTRLGDSEGMLLWEMRPD
jgi:[ribosomal protein S5]-alanine N-acetyltransferase